MVKLSKRLRTIHDLVPKCVPADIGSDHGKLMIALVESGKIEKGYAIENKEGPYERLKNNLIQAGVIDVVVPLYSDGLEDLPEIVDTLIIAGMGGINIIGILKKNPRKLEHIQTIIIDAHSSVPTVRKEICRMGFTIADEKIINEGNIYYEIIKFIRGECALLSDEDIEYGPVLRQEKCAIFKEKYQNRISEIEKIISSGSIPEDRFDLLSKEKCRLKKNV
ncbi:MAG: SAM-dependent methyltransferase [Erysipelotrichaceae bacterium]|mgnify:CR=1 FL=1|jgi:tRNA (adenine22-N1)-methyltransferase|nr:SAM-dependent methyltransferase [Erysipelotrichaceae bacterium]